MLQPRNTCEDVETSSYEASLLARQHHFSRPKFEECRPQKRLSHVIVQDVVRYGEKLRTQGMFGG